MTYHLAALRLHSIGERSARFPDVTLDFTAPRESTAAAADSIVWLRNGGGKSSLMSLFYALLLPRATDFMGRSVKRSLTDYIDSGDTSHTVAVWHPAVSTNLFGLPDRVLVTGAVYEWADLRRPADAERARDKLEATYYAFYAVPGAIDPERMPINDESGAPRRRQAFIAALKETAAAHPQAMDLVTTERQHEWATQLTNRGLDPALFRTQKQMNHVEGGVDELFKVSSAREFVDLFIDLTVSPEDASNVAERLSSIAAIVATKPNKEHERAFCLDAVAGLERVVVAQRGVQDADGEFTQATAEGAALAAMFHATVADAKNQQQLMAAEKTLAEARKSAAEIERGTAYDLEFLYERRAAELRHADAQGRSTAAEYAVTDATALVAAWEAAEHLSAKSETEQSLGLVRLEAARELIRSEPQRRAYDEHTARLHLRLSSLAAEHDTRGITAAERAQAAAQARADLQGEASQARAAAQAADKDIAQARARIENLAADLRAAARDGALPTESTDPATYDSDLKERETQLGAVIADIRTRRTQRTVRRTAATSRLTQHTSDLTRLDGDRAALASEREDITRRAEEITANPRVRDLVEATDEAPVDLWAESETLTRRLTNAIVEADLELVRLEAGHIEDKRTLDAYQRTGLLPTTLDAEQVRTTLADHGITAETGWQHLRSVLPDEHLQAAPTDPDLSRIGVGIVIPTEQEQAALAALAAVDTTTTALVGLYTAYAVDAITDRASRAVAANEDGPSWTALHHGLIDGDRAETTIAKVTTRAQAHASQQTAVSKRRAEDRALLESVTTLWHRSPAGHLPGLTSRIEDLDKAITEHDKALDDIQQELLSIEQAETEDSDLHDTAQAEITTTGRIRARLTSLIERTAHALAWGNDLRTAEARYTEAAERAEILDEQADTAFETTTQAKALADKEQGAAATLRAEANALTYLEHPPTPEDDPDIALDTLRHKHDEARRAWQAQASQSVLAEREEKLAEALAKANATLTAIEHHTQSRAAALLRTPDGQTARQRASALTAARTSEHEAIDLRGRATSDLVRQADELKAIAKRRAEPPRRTLPLEPTDAAHAEAMAAEHRSIGQSAIERRSIAEKQIADLDRDDTDLTNAIALFALLADDLPEPERSGAPAFAGTAGHAKERKRTATERMRNAELALAEAKGGRTKTVASLRGLGVKYPTVTTPAKDRVLHDAEETLARNAVSLTNSLALRANMIDGELAGIAKDQSIVTDALARLVANVFDTLRKAERFSRLDAKTVGWAGRQVLRVSFDEPASQADLRTYVDRVIERRVALGAKPEGLPLLKEAVHEAAAPRGFTVKVTKPARGTVATTEDIARLGKWSGGEKLTVCVAVYCTIAALRAANAGRKDLSGGVLLLDNPIGRASNPDLVQLQRAVAAAHKVQLIYTTGVKDPVALSLFPNVIRLDNRPGRTHNRRYIVPDDTGLPDAGHITGARAAYDEFTEPDADMLAEEGRP